MGIDLKAGGRVRSRKRTAPKSDNPYLGLLVKLYKFMARRTGSKFHSIILRRLMQSQNNRARISTSKLARHSKGKRERTIVTCSSVLHDSRRLNLPAMKVCAMHFTEEARRQITKAGGSCITFDQLAMKAPRGENTILLRGKRHAREVYRHFGPAPGTKGSHTAPYTSSRKSERCTGIR
eukprot:gnl/Trimastix_PCT/99.p1 GENE.gnl/Trimastix_PCT/99~~gnl/Trimastix_PCT/99.p1  ORF type:complete len:179 (-),score=35.66 gnl/Trimastix_PCT/99:67-603(-)